MNKYFTRPLKFKIGLPVDFTSSTFTQIKYASVKLPQFELEKDKLRNQFHHEKIAFSLSREQKARNFLRSEKLSLKFSNPDIMHEKREGRASAPRRAPAVS